MASLEERVSRLEGGYEHLATKADLQAMETRLIKWMIGMMIGAIAIACSLALFIQRIISG